MRWSDEVDSLRRIRRLGGVPVHGRPLHLDQRGASVAVVQRGGLVRYIFECKSIDGPLPVTLADGSKTDRGFILRARKGTIHVPGDGEPHTLTPRWYAIGQFRYVDGKWRSVLVSSDGRRDRGYIDESPEGPGSELRLRMHPYKGGIPGRERTAPEAKLVDDYVEWIGRASRFGHLYLRTARLFTDLLDRTFWRLIEAKATSDRRTLRTAVGQLMDYRRFFRRGPSLGVLLPNQPTGSDLEFLGAYKITAIWRTPSGRFSDSSSDRRWSRRDPR